MAEVNHEKSGADVSLDERVRLKKADRSELSLYDRATVPKN